MILEELKVNNYRVFSGEHVFDLSPRTVDGHMQPIILFGGLNGSGKTTILSAIRLALYGKRSLGNKISEIEYQKHLTESIHRSSNILVPRNTSSIELNFTYARHGEKKNYQVKREWSIEGDKLKETLKIFQNNYLLKEFGYKKSQAFLNELIPVGVSDLFFFDGEKIADLAEDETGHILREAVKKLLGLDIIEHLRNDLVVFQNKNQTLALPEKIQNEINHLNKEYLKKEIDKEKLYEELDFLMVEMSALKSGEKQVEAEIDSLGGAWAKTRSEEQLKQINLIEQQSQLEKRIREVMAGGFPLTLMSNITRKLTKQLDQEMVQRNNNVITNTLTSKIEPLTEALKAKLPAVHHEVIADIVLVAMLEGKGLPHSEMNANYKHELTEKESFQIQHCINQVIPKSHDEFRMIKLDLDVVTEELATASLRIERAPDERHLQKPIAELKEITLEQGVIQEKKVAKKQEIHKVIRSQIDINRQLKKQMESKKASTRDDSCLVNAKGASRLLLDFSEQTTENRLKDLEGTFMRSFNRLSRKDDVQLVAKIDKKTFEVHLLDEQKRPINKKDLSAGERQIFAIAILEALAKTSGRKLPVIIDTPLGRLDSKHRNKLVGNYFPTASHQVIILSTDTEVDHGFYSNLVPDISHAFQIHFDSKSQSSSAVPGYFWQQNKIERKNVS